MRPACDQASRAGEQFSYLFSFPEKEEGIADIWPFEDGFHGRIFD